MSTICGHFVNNSKIKSTDIYDMLKKMEHRGPDTHGVYLDGRLLKVDEVDELKENLSNESHIALGHSRLNYVDYETEETLFLKDISKNSIGVFNIPW